MTTHLTALVAEERRTDLLAEADNYRRARQARQAHDQTAPRRPVHQHHWGRAFGAFMKDVATAQL
jgi:hypothetical protein